MEKQITPEDLISAQLAACLAAMQDCLDRSRDANDKDNYGHLRRNDVATFAKLMKASARLTESLARLKGRSRHDLYVLRGDAPAQIVDRLLVDKDKG